MYVQYFKLLYKRCVLPCAYFVPITLNTIIAVCTTTINHDGFTYIEMKYELYMWYTFAISS